MGDRFGPSAEGTGRNMVGNHESVGLAMARVQIWTAGKVQRGRVAVQSTIRTVEHLSDQDWPTGGVRPTQVPVVSEVKPWSDRSSGGNDSDWTHAWWI